MEMSNSATEQFLHDGVEVHQLDGTSQGYDPVDMEDIGVSGEKLCVSNGAYTYYFRLEDVRFVRPYSLFYSEEDGYRYEYHADIPLADILATHQTKS